MAGAAKVAHPPAGNGTVENGEKLTAAQRKKLKQKQRKQAKKVEREELEKRQQEVQQKAKATTTQNKDDAVEIEYVSAPIDLLIDENAASEGNNETAELDEFRKIFQRFGTVEDLMAGGDGNDALDGDKDRDEEDKDGEKRANGDNEEGPGGSDSEDDEEKLSRRKKKMANQIKIAELKQAAERPEVVEVWDVTAADPKFLVYLKSYRNTVPVPRHWSQKRKYLQGKRGIEKPAFKLPAFIEATGIGEMRQSYLEKQEQTKLKQKARERMAPKMGKLDIDYQVLYDAFFRHQTKPHLSRHGELYYEGKEYEATTKHAKPGYLSPALQEALGITPGAPPPWLVAMQRYGPPPSYRSLRIPGLNAPIPAGAQFGYHAGGWGKPPVDEYGNPIYGDVFNQGYDQDEEDEMLHEKGTHWGDLESEEEAESEEEEEEEEEPEEDEEANEAALADGFTSTQSGLASSIPSGIETPAEVQLRKQPEDEGPKQLYQVLEQKKTSVGTSLMGSEHTYVVPGAEGGEKKMSLAAQKRLEKLRKEMPSDLDVSINPEELEGLDDAALKELYDMRLKEQRIAAGREDFSDLVAAKAATQKRKATETKSGKDKKFKF